ncbi:lycopene epsilon cyclase, chloroplastic-like [Actinidia eriantha]|uniref:lycopene epsilon cyclase, chloroplastic-like n=1 Tax=Actinidia eriantha TaxID=165200 RepID=UPI002586CECF|nr:lycopene epsilon cyclase, chloroplastic-like [Actinidia eriantha]
MECIGARNFAAMAVSACPNWRSRRKRPGSKQNHPIHRYNSWCKSSLRARCSSSAGNGSCVAVKEEFADEEDYVKAGGSELLFVQMQQNKDMDKQSKLTDKLPRISVGNTLLDLVVIGCGPAGLALAAESAKLGLSVGLIGPDLPFTNNYGVWEDEFRDLGLAGCIEHVWRDTIVYLDDNDPILIGRAYGRVSRHLLHEELLKRCVESGVSYLSSKVERIIDATNGQSLIECEQNNVVPCRLATVASGAASGKLLQYEVGGPRVSVQTAYGIEVEVENNPYDPSLMVFMDYRDYAKQKAQCLEAQYPTFLYAMPMSPTRVFFEETCLASKDAMPFDLLKKKLISRLETMGVRILKIYEEEWSYIPVGGSLPNTEQKNLAFGAAASMVHPATGYSVVRSLSEAPKYASVISKILKQGHSKEKISQSRSTENISMQAWNTLWPQERKRQRAFFLFGLALILQLDIDGIREFFHTFFRLPSWMCQGFLGSTLSSADLALFAVYMFVVAPNNMRKCLIRHLLSDPTGAIMLRTYLTI